MEIDSSSIWNNLKYFLLAIFPILSLYDFIPLLDLGYLMLLFIIIIELIRKRLMVEINLDILCTMMILITINLLVGIFKYLDSTNTINNTGGMIVFTFLAVFVCYPGFSDKDQLYKACKIIGILATIFLFCQFVGYNFFHVILKGNIPFLTFQGYGFQSIEYGRPTSIFYEPAHYCIYIAPIYAMSLIKKEYFITIIFFIGVVLSTSMTGILLVLIIPMIIGLKKSKSFLFVIIFVIFAMILVSLLPSSYDQYFNKLSFVNLMENNRILGTLIFFQYFSMTDWFFGVGINRMAEFLSNVGELYATNYANALIFSLFSFGIVGSLFLLNLCVNMYRIISANYKVMWYILLFVLVSDQVLFNRNLLYLLIWIFAVSQQPENRLIRSDAGHIKRVL